MSLHPTGPRWGLSSDQVSLASPSGARSQCGRQGQPRVGRGGTWGALEGHLVWGLGGFWEARTVHVLRGMHKENSRRVAYSV